MAVTVKFKRNYSNRKKSDIVNVDPAVANSLLQKGIVERVLHSVPEQMVQEITAKTLVIAKEAAAAKGKFDEEKAKQDMITFLRELFAKKTKAPTKQAK